LVKRRAGNRSVSTTTPGWDAGRCIRPPGSARRHERGPVQQLPAGRGPGVARHGTARLPAPNPSQPRTLCGRPPGPPNSVAFRCPAGIMGR
jgi:hypothetical protein